MENGPVVSVIVITYNSSRTVIETLDSIKNQSYRNIELIVTDDKSKDNTVAICKEWVERNRNNFIDSAVIESEINTGISANCNRGIMASHGEWIRIIAGDDLIPDAAIETQISYIRENENVRILNGYYINFKEDNGVKTELPCKKKIEINANFYSSTADEQYKFLLRHYDFGLTDGTLVHRSVYQNITMYDEKYSMIEDLPFWLRVTKAGVKYHYLDTPTMLYRIHESVVHPAGKRIANQTFWDIRRRIINDMIKPNLPWSAISCRKKIMIDSIMYWFIFRVFHNKSSFMSRAVLFVLYRL